MRFEWDEAKNKRNIAKHGVDFDLAKGIFDGPVYSVFDTRDDYGEDRELSIGMISGVVFLTVIHTQRDIDLIRIISARKATRLERTRYEENL